MPDFLEELEVLDQNLYTGYSDLRQPSMGVKKFNEKTSKYVAKMTSTSRNHKNDDNTLSVLKNQI